MEYYSPIKSNELLQHGGGWHLYSFLFGSQKLGGLQFKASHVCVGGAGGFWNLPPQPIKSYIGSITRRIIVQAGLGINVEKIPKALKRDEGMAQVVDGLFSKPKALSSNPSTTKKQSLLYRLNDFKNKD
jgi:hypothetical protein